MNVGQYYFIINSVEYASQCMSEFVNEFLILLESWTDEEFNSHVSKYH